MQQHFAGRAYTFHEPTRRYRAYEADGTRGGAKRVLHRDVYSSEYGNIPHGWHVHHRDEDVHNNALENLEALAPLDHARLHKTRFNDYVCVECGSTFQSAVLHRNIMYCSGLCRSRVYERTRPPRNRRKET